MAEEITIAGDKFEISSAHQNWTCCDLHDGFIAVINESVGLSNIVNKLVSSPFQYYEYNKPFRSKVNRAYCIRFKLDKKREKEVVNFLETFN